MTYAKRLNLIVKLSAHRNRRVPQQLSFHVELQNENPPRYLTRDRPLVFVVRSAENQAKEKVEAQSNQEVHGEKDDSKGEEFKRQGKVL